MNYIYTLLWFIFNLVWFGWVKYPTLTESILVPFFYTFKTLGFFSWSISLPNSLFNLSNSCSNTRIEYCYIVSGGDCITIKSGWDQYGIKFGMRTEDLVICRLTCISPDSAISPLAAKCRLQWRLTHSLLSETTYL